MKFTNLLLSFSALAFLVVGCGGDNKEDLGTPSVNISVSELSIEKTSGSQTIQITATRDWNATSNVDWIAVDPASGKASTDAQTVTITVLENTGLDRSGTVTFDIGFDSKTLTVNQAGTGSEEDNIVYANDFDKEAATQTYGTSSSSWPYLDQFEGWKNEKGTGIANVDYEYSGMSARNNSNSNGSYSDYAGSGVNNMFFGSDSHFEVKNIALGAGVDYSLSFGTEKYAYGADDNTFDPTEFHVYISNDGTKWVELSYSFANGYKDGRWDLASSVFTVPSGTSSLYIYVKSDLTSAHRMDDLKLSVSSTAGTVIDFSKGITIGGDEPVTPKTITEIIALADGTAIKTEDALVVAKGTSSFVATDGTSNILVYGATSAAAVKIGDKVAIEASKTTYGSIPELSAPTVTVASSGTEVTYPTVKDITSTFDSYASTSVEYITYTGTLSVVTSGTKTYYNIAVAGATTKTGSISGPSDDLNVSALDGQAVIVTGYFAGLSGSDKYVNILPTAIKAADANAKIFNVSPLTLSATASETSTSFSITSNVDWTASSDNEAFTLDKTSGNGDATVNISFAANTEATSKTANITVSTDADVTTKTYTVKITQAGTSSENYSSNVTWTTVSSAYDQAATVNGQADVAVLKLGTSSKVGSATISVPSGSSKISFYAYSWVGKVTTLNLSLGETLVKSTDINGNDGCTGNPPYTITAAAADKITIDLGTTLTANTEYTFTTVSNTSTRAVIFAVNAE